MKNRIISIFLIVLCVFILTGCDIGKEKNEKTDISKMSKEKIRSRLISISNDLTDLWNEVICQISYYSGDGKSSTGENLDIDFVIKTSKKYFDKVVDNKEFIDKLDDSYFDIKEAYDKAVEQATIIYENIQKETPKPGKSLKYKKNIDLFSQYQMYFWKSLF